VMALEMGKPLAQGEAETKMRVGVRYYAEHGRFLAPPPRGWKPQATSASTRSAPCWR
jgi:hypothetical protein